jgi:hypothetical protein
MVATFIPRCRLEKGALCDPKGKYNEVADGRQVWG